MRYPLLKTGLEYQPLLKTGLEYQPLLKAGPEYQPLLKAELPDQPVENLQYLQGHRPIHRVCAVPSHLVQTPPIWLCCTC